MASKAGHKSFRTLPLHAAVGGCLGAGLCFGLANIDGSAFAIAIRTNEMLVMLSLIFASYFAVGSALTGFLLIASE